MVFCSYYNVGYCKYKDKCFKEHAKTECNNNNCDKNDCQKRHKKLCRYGNKCTYKNKNSCEFRHDDKIATSNDEVKRVQIEANQFKRECESLKADIKDLKITIHEQQLKLNSITNENKRNQDISKKNEKLLSTQFFSIELTLKEEQVKYEENYNKHKNELIARDETIKSLQIKLSEANKSIETMKFTAKEMTHKSIDIISPEIETFLCRICDKSHISKESLKSHIKTKHESFHYSNTDSFKCKICGNEFKKGKLITQICIDNHIIVKYS